MKGLVSHKVTKKIVWQGEDICGEEKYRHTLNNVLKYSTPNVLYLIKGSKNIIKVSRDRIY